MPTKYLKLTACIIVVAALPLALKAQSKKYESANDGVVVYPDRELSGGAQIVKLQVISDKIIRVMASAEAGFSDKKV